MINGMFSYLSHFQESPRDLDPRKTERYPLNTLIEHRSNTEILKKTILSALLWMPKLWDCGFSKLQFFFNRVFFLFGNMFKLKMACLIISECKNMLLPWKIYLLNFFLDNVKGIHKNVFIKCNVTLVPKAFLNVLFLLMTLFANCSCTKFLFFMTTIILEHSLSEKFCFHFLLDFSLCLFSSLPKWLLQWSSMLCWSQITTVYVPVCLCLPSKYL